MCVCVCVCVSMCVKEKSAWTLLAIFGSNKRNSERVVEKMFFTTVWVNEANSN